jgi:hypothetical protein
MNATDEQKLAAIDQFRLELARAAQFAKLIDDETKETHLSHRLVSIAVQVGKAREILSKKYDSSEDADAISYQGA